MATSCTYSLAVSTATYSLAVSTATYSFSGLSVATLTVAADLYLWTELGEILLAETGGAILIE